MFHHPRKSLLAFLLSFLLPDCNPLPTSIYFCQYEFYICLKLYFIRMDLNIVHSIVSILFCITLSYLYSSILVHVSVVYSLYCYFIYVDLFIHYLFIHLPADGYLGYLKFCIFLRNLWTFEYKFCVCICFYLGKYLEVGFLDKHIANFWKTAEGFFKEVIPLAI